ncbi:MAG: Class II abasic (AP) endonuclease [Geoglossum simile]|nr:MAG: Class II abasic (AP) endonuclease [Geoglossum simile]
MFDILEADIVVMQETKIQRKDLQDDMVLVPGWDCYFSLPKYKKGYSGVAIYTRQSSCAPIRAEEGVTGVLCLPGSSTSYLDLPEDECIGGYPTCDQLSRSPVDAATLDSEGRCLILEFPAFVLIGVYSPATRDQSRDEFRLGFLNALDARIRNLVAEGKRVVLTGDMNVVREEIDMANVEEQMRKYGMTGEFVSMPSRRILNQLLVGGKVISGRDEGREQSVMWDICRAFHEGRKGMFTHWEQKINARPGNFGSRIDYVLCSYDMRDWFCESNIQEGLLGSDHCPVYAVIKDSIRLGDSEVNISDLVNPCGTFKDGKRLKAYSAKDLLALSAKLIPEFDRRRNIRDMFARKLSLVLETGKDSSALDNSNGSSPQGPADERGTAGDEFATPPQTQELNSSSTHEGSSRSSMGLNKSQATKRPATEASSSKPSKRSKPMGTQQLTGKGQQSLKGFFKPKAPVSDGNKTGSTTDTIGLAIPSGDAASDRDPPSSPLRQASTTTMQPASPPSKLCLTHRESSVEGKGDTGEQGDWAADEGTEIHDPIVAKESWSILFSKRHPPKCEGHDEHCIRLTTKKPGVNCGRAFWICPR